MRERNQEQYEKARIRHQKQRENATEEERAAERQANNERDRSKRTSDKLRVKKYHVRDVEQNSCMRRLLRNVNARSALYVGNGSATLTNT